MNVWDAAWSVAFTTLAFCECYNAAYVRRTWYVQTLMRNVQYLNSINLPDKLQCRVEKLCKKLPQEADEEDVAKQPIPGQTAEDTNYLFLQGAQAFVDGLFANRQESESITIGYIRERFAEFRGRCATSQSKEKSPVS